MQNILDSDLVTRNIRVSYKVSCNAAFCSQALWYQHQHRLTLRYLEASPLSTIQTGSPVSTNSRISRHFKANVYRLSSNTPHGTIHILSTVIMTRLYDLIRQSIQTFRYYRKMERRSLRHGGSTGAQRNHVMITSNL